MRKGRHLAVEYSRSSPRFLDERGLATGMLHHAKEELAYIAVPFSEDSFAVGSDDEGSARLLAETLLGHRSEFWGSYGSLPQALHQFIWTLVDHGCAFAEVEFQDGELKGIEYLPPETIFLDRSRGRHVYEQYIPRTRSGASFYCRFSEEEVLSLSWPLPEAGGGAPILSGLKEGREADRLSTKGRLSRLVSIDQNETYLPNVLGRLGFYNDADLRMFTAIDRAADRLFEPPERDVTDFFRVQRVSRQRAAAYRLRDYLLDQLNEQILGRWCALSNVPHARLKFLPSILSAAEWEEVPSQYLAGELTSDDIPRLIELEDEAVRAFDEHFS